VTCFKRKKQGHYANECDEENTDDKDDNTKKDQILLIKGNMRRQKPEMRMTIVRTVTKKQKVLKMITSLHSCSMM